MKKLMMLAVAAIVVACQSEVKVPTFYKLSSVPFSIEGNHAELVKGLSTEWFLFRDTVGNAETDTVYKVTVDAKLCLLKSYSAERMDTFPQLKFLSETGRELVVMDVADSTSINDILQYFLQGEVGSENEIRFVGTMNKSDYLLLPTAKQAVLTHFSLYDPEANADPKITQLILEYKERCDQEKELLDDGMGASTTMMRYAAETDDVASSLAKQVPIMTPSQKEEYKAIKAKREKLAEQE